MKKRFRAVYQGRGFVPGVPARDLSEAEVELYGRAALRRGGLWALVEVEDGRGLETGPSAVATDGEIHDGDRLEEVSDG